MLTRNRVSTAASFAATFGAICGGFVSPTIVLASGLLFWLATKAEKPAPFSGLLLLMWAWIAAEFICEWLLIFTASTDPSGLFDYRVYFFDWLTQSPRFLRQAQIGIAFFLLNELARRPQAIIKCLSAARISIVIALLFILGQQLFYLNISWIPAFFAGNIPPFFLQQARLAGTFVDPNSAGIALAFAVLLSLQFKDRLWRVLGLLSFLALLVTGSRSGISMVVVFLVVRAATHTPRSFVLTAVSLVSLSFIGLLAINLLPVAFFENLPVTVSRVALSLRMDTFSASAFSRLALWRVAFAEWTHAPILGVGLDRYRELLPPFAQALGIKTGSWNDNPGSLPIFLLTELGLIGMLVFVADFLRLKPERDFPSLNMPAWCCALAAPLFFGCHTHDALGAIFYGAALSFVVQRKSESEFADPASLKPALIVLLITPFIAMTALNFPRGFFPWEMHGEILARWSGSNASMVISCAGPLPQIQQTATLAAPQKVLIQSPGSSSGTELCKADDSKTLRKSVQISVAPTWVPKSVGIGADERALGVLLTFPSPVALDDL